MAERNLTWLDVDLARARYIFVEEVMMANCLFDLKCSNMRRFGHAAVR
jgi:hypothetical protein